MKRRPFVLLLIVALFMPTPVSAYAEEARMGEASTGVSASSEELLDDEVEPATDEEEASVSSSDSGALPDSLDVDVAEDANIVESGDIVEVVVNDSDDAFPPVGEGGGSVANEKVEQLAKEASQTDGWLKETNEDGSISWYFLVSGEKVTGYTTIAGKHYFFDDESAELLCNASHRVEDKLLLFGDDGSQVTGGGWKKLGDVWYWVNQDHSLRTGWLYDGAWYYLDPDTGVMKQGEVFGVKGVDYVARSSGACPASSWVMLGGSWYLTNGSCAVRTGWAQVKGTWYYLDEQTGAMKENCLFKVKGATYIARPSGACPASSWVELDGAWYLTNGSCAVRSGWAQVKGTWYYLDKKTYVMKQSEPFVVSGTTYIANTSGACPANAWVSADGSWFRTNSSCAARTGWASVNGVWYYLNAEKDKSGIYGRMATGLVEVSGKRYYLNSNGSLAVNRFIKLGDGTEAYASSDGSLGAYRKNGTYYNSDGSTYNGWLKSGSDWLYLVEGKPKTGWLQLGSKWYWLDSNGIMVTGKRSINGKTYYFKDNGEWIDVDAVRSAIVDAAYSQVQAGAAYTELNDYYKEDVAFNCSGFSYWCYMKAGYIIPRKQGYYSYYWNEENKEYSQMWWVEKRTTDVSKLKRGDLVFFSPINDKYHTGHVGVYVGDGQMIDAYPVLGVSRRSVWQSGFVGGGSPIF